MTEGNIDSKTLRDMLDLHAHTLVLPGHTGEPIMSGSWS